MSIHELGVMSAQACPILDRGQASMSLIKGRYRSEANWTPAFVGVTSIKKGEQKFRNLFWQIKNGRLCLELIK